MGFVVSPCAAISAQPLTGHIAAKPAALPEIKHPPHPLIAPVTPPASAEAIVMQNAQRPDPPQGIEFDDVPYTGDAAILVDDIKRPDSA